MKENMRNRGHKRDVVMKTLVEESGSRTHQGRLPPLARFEVWAPHQGAILLLQFNHFFRRASPWINRASLIVALDGGSSTIEILENTNSKISADASSIFEFSSRKGFFVRICN